MRQPSFATMVDCSLKKHQCMVKIQQWWSQLKHFPMLLEGMNNSMMQIGAGLCKSLEVVAHAMMAPTNQNLFYQNPATQPGFSGYHPMPYNQRAFQQSNHNSSAPNQNQQNDGDETTYSQLF